MSEHDWDALGHEAVELGWHWAAGMREVRHGLVLEVYTGGDTLEARVGGRGWGEIYDDWAPDFSDRLTALACIAWVEDVAREVYGANVGVSACMIPGRAEAAVVIGVDVLECRRGPTLPHAAIEAVRAMKGAE